MQSPIVATLSFDPGVEKQWREVLFAGVKKDARDTVYSTVMTGIAKAQDALKEETMTIIQRLGGGDWCTLSFRTVFSTINLTIITSVRKIPVEATNAQIIEFADSAMSNVLADIQLEDDEISGRALTKFMFLSGLIKMYDAGRIECTAGSTAAKRIVECLDGLMIQMDDGDLKCEDAMIIFFHDLKRIHKAVKRRSDAS